jgi:hypothetical protein
LTKTNASILIKLNRWLVWLTLPLFIIFAFCGYGITNPTLTMSLTGGLFNRATSTYLHTTLAPIVLFLSTVHILIGAKFALIRKGIKDGLFLNAFLTALGAFITILIVIFQLVKT